MREAIAFARIKWRTVQSYRAQFVLSFVGLIVTLIPLYLVGRALDPLMAPKIGAEGGEFFGFLLVGTALLPFAILAMQVLPNEVGSGVSTGTFEAMLATPVRLPSLFVGFVSYDLIWTSVRTLVLLTFGTILGATIAPQQIFALAVVVMLIVLAHLPIGLLATAFMLMFRTTLELPKLAMFASAIFAGIYYPTSVIPEQVRVISSLVPLTYGLRAARRVALQGASLADVASELAMLAAFAVLLGVVGLVILRAALISVRRAGTLAHY
jgi:ABC-2 type transport system permease protein